MMGWLREDSFLSGTMKVEPELARTAIQTHIADKLGTGVDEAAMGIFKILAHSMTEAISLHSVRKGYDPRDFSLIAEGGAGPPSSHGRSQTNSAFRVSSCPDTPPESPQQSAC